MGAVNPLAVLACRPRLRRLATFCVVGGLGAAVNTAALALLHSGLHWPVAAASALATELAIVHNYVLNDRVTFGLPSLSASRFARFNMVSIGGLAVTVATVTLLSAATGMPVVVANLGGMVLALAWNFVANLRWTWASAAVASDTAPAVARTRSAA